MKGKSDKPTGKGGLPKGKAGKGPGNTRKTDGLNAPRSKWSGWAGKSPNGHPPSPWPGK